jgi:hypothetical protein
VTLKPKDRIAISLPGPHRTVEVLGTVYDTGIGPDGKNVGVFIDGTSWGVQVDPDRIRKLPEPGMAEPVEFGALLMTDKGLALRHTSRLDHPHPWVMDGTMPGDRGIHSWADLENPREVAK